jgi:uncharacterized protein (DUF1015 family)
VLWAVTETADRDGLVAAFAEVPELYVADGHHRSAAATRIRALRRDANPAHTGKEPYNFFLSVIFPDNQMKILEYNRVVRDLRGYDEASLVQEIAKLFEVERVEDGRPTGPKTFGMYLDGHWYRLTARPGTYPDSDPVRGLDVAVLQDNLLAPVLGIGDPRSDERVDFVGGIRGLIELERLVNEGMWAAAFVVYPTSIDQLFAVADAGQVMPPKSTWFEPKLRSGLIVRPLED